MAKYTADEILKTHGQYHAHRDFLNSVIEKRKAKFNKIVGSYNKIIKALSDEIDEYYTRDEQYRKRINIYNINRIGYVKIDYAQVGEIKDGIVQIENIVSTTHYDTSYWYDFDIEWFIDDNWEDVLTEYFDEEIATMQKSVDSGKRLKINREKRAVKTEKAELKRLQEKYETEIRSL